MKVYEVLADAAETAGRNDLAAALKTLTFDGGGAEDINLFLRCYNIVINEIAAEYFPLNTAETFETADGKIYFKDFDKTPSDILKVYGENFEELPYELFTTYTETKAGKVNIKYNYIPEASGFTDNFIYENTKIQNRIVVFGTAAEYFLVKGMYNEAQIWQNRYKDGLLSSLTPRKLKKMKARIWGL